MTQLDQLKQFTTVVADTGDIEAVELALPQAGGSDTGGTELPWASGIERLSLRTPVSIDAGARSLYSEEPLELLVEGEEVAIFASRTATATPSAPARPASRPRCAA